ncbi:hypothetical protein RBB50_010784 [Rhinocladiella similis]
MESRERPAKRQRLDLSAPVNNASSSLKRVSRACDSCRVRKNRCDGQHPTCGACAKAGLECVYERPTKKRGYAAGYVRALEALWALVFKAVPKSEETALTLLRQAVVRFDSEEKVIFQSDYLGPADSLRTIWETSSLRGEIDSILARLERGHSSVSHDDNGNTSTTADITLPSPLQQWEVPQEHPVEVANLNPASDAAESSFIIPDETLLGMESASGQRISVPDAICEAEIPACKPPPLPPDAWLLIDRYFNFNACWLPIVRRHNVVRILSSVQDSSGCHPHEAALLCAIFALSIEAHDEHQAYLGNQTSNELAETYYASAVAFQPGLHAHYRLEHVQVILLLTIFNMAADRWQAAFLTLGQAVRALLLLQSSNCYDIDPTMSDQLDQTELTYCLLASFALDTIISAALNVVPHLRQADMERHIDFDENRPEEWHQWSDSEVPCALPGHAPQPVRALSTFKAYVKLLMLMNDVASGSLSRLGSDDHSTLGGFLRRLEDWKADIPKHCHMNSNTGTLQAVRPPSPPVANLWITFETVRFYLQGLSGSCIRDVSQVAGWLDEPGDTPCRRLFKTAFGKQPWKGIVNLHRRMALTLRHGRETMGAERGSISIHNTKQYSERNTIGNTPLGQGMSDRNTIGRVYFTPVAPGEFTISQRTALPNSMTATGNDILDPRNLSMELPPLTPDVLGRSRRFSGARAVDLDANFGDPEPSSGYLDPFSRLGEADTIESLLDELSTTQDSEWNALSSQFRYNLGFYSAMPP